MPIILYKLSIKYNNMYTTVLLARQ